MAENQAGEKTEEATPKRKQDARKRGTVARSTELNGAVVLLAVAMALPSAASMLSEGMLTSLRSGVSRAPVEFSYASLARNAWAIAAPCVQAFGLLAAVAMLAGIVVNLAQVGFAFSPEVLKPNLAKLNPMEGAKRLFSVRGAMEGAKAMAKCVFFGLIAYSAIHAQWAALGSLGVLPVKQAAALVGGIMQTIIMRVAIAWLCLAALDYFFQRKQVDNQLKMTKDELKREMKEQEGSPEIRQAQFKRRRELMKRRPLDAVKNADVVITNPTHYAIAIQYKRNEMHSPMVVAKGMDYLAFKIRDIAKENRVPIIPNPPLARALYKKCEVGDFIPRDMFAAVAEVLAYVYQTLKKVKS